MLVCVWNELTITLTPLSSSIEVEDDPCVGKDDNQCERFMCSWKMIFVINCKDHLYIMHNEGLL